ncbi:12062_t:CDS:2 [Gigaspora margarita]|uniref:12062_t:CDS:1 n=1 Tax=Gigaspora margarita TaxID=4874 RepID=A0ABN7W3D5_GIGMA|nr:12062_t:CDS:2 [Gigaspora margarita]
MKCPLLIECLKTRALEWIEENSTDDWQYKVASYKKLLYPYASFSAALLAYLRLLVRHPIAKLLFILEKLSVTKSFISINQTRRNQDLIPFLKTIFLDPKILNINDLPEPKPDHYVMPELFYDLKLPFSYYFMKKINGFKTAWGDELEKLREDPDNCDDDQELSHDAFENAVQGFIMVANDADKKDSELLAKLVQLYIGKDKALDPVLLHIYWWKHSNVISADLQLAQMCPSVINEFTREGQDGSFEECLVNKVIKMMLDKFAKKGSEPQLDQWQHLEIIKLGLGSDEQNVLSKKFVNHDPFPLMGSIITKIFWKEEDAINEPFLRILQDSKKILQVSPRLKVINSALKNNNLDSSMATLFQALLEKTFEPLKRISAIAFLKEFVYCMWYQTLQDDYTLPISFIGIMDISEFDDDVLIDEINNFLSGASENQVAEFLKIISTMNNLSNGYKQTIEKILLHRQPLLRLDNTIDNINLFLKSVIAHIASLHASIPPESTPFATYFHKIETCQNSSF